NVSGNGGSESANLTGLVNGATYFIRVYHFGTNIPSNPTFTICVSPELVMPQCAASTPAGNTCAEAVLICDVNGYCGSTSATYSSDSWPELSTAFCGSIENNSFIQFVADQSTVSLNVWVTSSTTNQGIQIMVFSANNCSGPVNTYTCVSPLAPSPNAQGVTVTGLTPGNTYYMMIDGFAGDVCNYVIGVNSGIQVSGNITTTTPSICLGSSVQLNASGGNGTYDWTPNSDLNTLSGATVMATPTVSGQHTYSMTSYSSNPFCPSTNTSQITINVAEPPNPNAGIDDTVCLGDPIFLVGSIASPANSPSWQFLTSGISPTPTVSFSPNFSNLTPTVTVNQPGLYRFILRENNSVCGIYRDTVQILVQQLTQSFDVVLPSCFGMMDGSINVINSEATEFSLDGGTTWSGQSLFENLSSGFYTVCSRNAIGCEVCDEVEIPEQDPLLLEVSNDTTVCENGTATLFAQAFGGTSFIYHWSHTIDNSPMQLVSPEDDQTYIVYAENENGCLSEEDSIDVSVLNSITGIVSQDIFVCPGYSGDLTATASGGNGGPYTFNWSTGDVGNGLSDMITVTPTSSIPVTVEVEDGCESSPVSFTVNVNVAPLPLIGVSTTDPSVCEPAYFNVQSTTDASLVEHIEWNVSNGQSFTDQENIIIEDLYAGVYDIQVIVTTPDGCIDSTTFNNYLTVYPIPDADFTYSPNPVKQFNTSVFLTNYTIGASNYEWFIEQGTPSYSQAENVQTSLPDGEVGSYEVILIATSEFGCIDTAIRIIDVKPEIILYVPNTFTPDDDEYNQTWGIFVEGIDIYNFELLIFNRWGEIIWESHDPAEKWDGTFQGNYVQQGIYTWRIESKDILTDEKFERTGFVNVIR
ncbi:MAG: gliding motility-associated C-terminal domain-containing protein, partial [Bacteroidetes bacterium]